MPDATKVASEAAQKALMERTKKRRRQAGNSLLATGGDGDPLNPATALPTAYGKRALGE